MSDGLKRSIARFIQHIDHDPDRVERELTLEMAGAFSGYRDQMRSRRKSNTVAEDMYARRNKSTVKD